MKKLTIVAGILSVLFTGTIFANSYKLPPSNDDLIGKVQYQTSETGDNVITIGEKYDVGFNAMQKANPLLDMNRGFTKGTSLQIPTSHLLPNQPRQGIVINLPEMRLYYYAEGSTQVVTYPIGIGKIGKTIPIKRAKVTRKAENPTWTPPEDIREFNLEQGIVLPDVMPPGPDNPLGPYAIYMSIPTYLIHSTIFPESIGKRASFGCIRMYQSDIEKLYPTVNKGIPIVIINDPVKVGWHKNKLYLEAYEPLEEHSDVYETSLPGIVSFVVNSTQDRLALVDWQAIAYISKERDGIPHEIGMTL
ncbi:MAG: hypothetical protein A3F12_03135 [Gammaproteobacteria bacterium RIFCSPHIGHO2_12_FULL_38_14]|nr:MAG: hypothetical protein A3F12_03135 [Gammaproteobacteria bacterium RIFCSPHIGHO2_12_FULL_38_14]